MVLMALASFIGLRVFLCYAKAVTGAKFGQFDCRAEHFMEIYFVDQESSL